MSAQEVTHLLDRCVFEIFHQPQALPVVGSVLEAVMRA